MADADALAWALQALSSAAPADRVALGAISLRLWLVTPDEHESAERIAELRAQVVRRGWSGGPTPPARPGDADWSVWRFFDEVVFSHPSAWLYAGPNGIEARGALRSAWRWPTGALLRARVDVPTGRGARTARAEFATPEGNVSFDLQGVRLRISGPTTPTVGRPSREADGRWVLEG